MRILLTGQNGQVGFELLRSLAPLGEVIGVDRRTLDLSDPDAIRRLVREIQPSVIVNPAAYTAVDRAETDKETAYAVNTTAPGVLAEEADLVSALLVHYSTDYVFDGTQADPYRETDIPNPQSVYGQSKWQGEQAIAAATGRHLILRTSWVVGAHGNNFAKTILRLAAEREQLNVVADQFGAPTSASLLADLTAHLVASHQRSRDAFPFGTYHVTASGDTHWCDYARFVASEALAAGRTLRARPEAILPITTAQYPTPAQRPSNSRLAGTKFTATFGLRLPAWQDGVRHVLRQIL